MLFSASCLEKNSKDNPLVTEFAPVSDSDDFYEFSRRFRLPMCQWEPFLPDIKARL
jgi:hypothetical protein